MALSDQEKHELKIAVREGVVEALQSKEAQEAVLEAVGTWFDKQSGKAARKLLIAAIIVIVLNWVAIPEIIKTWLKALGGQ